VNNQSAPAGKKSFGRAHLLTAIAFAAYGITKFSFNLVVQHFHGSVAVGNYNLVLSAALMLPLFFAPLFGVTTSKYAAEARGKNDRQDFLLVVGFNFWLLTGSAVLLGLLFYLFSPALAKWYGAAVELYYWGVPIIILSALYLYFKRLFFAVEQLKFYTLLEVTSALVFFISLGICLYLGFSRMLLLPLILQTAVFDAAALLFFRKDLFQRTWLRRLRHSKVQLRAYFNYSLVTGIGSALSTVSLHIFTLVLGSEADVRSVGRFALMRSTLEPANYLFRIFNMVQLPKIAFIYGSGNMQELGRYLKEGTRKYKQLISLLFVPVILCSHFIARMLYGNQYQWPLTLLAAFMLTTVYLRTMGVFYINFLNGTRFPHIPNSAGPLTIFAAVPFIPLAYNLWGLAGLGGLILLAEIVRYAWVAVAGKKKLNLLIHTIGDK